MLLLPQRSFIYAGWVFHSFVAMDVDGGGWETVADRPTACCSFVSLNRRRITENTIKYWFKPIY